MDTALLGAVAGRVVSLNAWGKMCQGNHTLPILLHGASCLAQNATATPSIAVQFGSDHLYDYLCMSEGVL